MSRNGIISMRHIETKFLSKIRAYEENKDGMGFFKFTGRTDEFLRYQNKSHSTMPKVGLIEDKNSDGVSDLMYWLFGDDAVINKKETNN